MSEMKEELYTDLISVNITSSVIFYRYSLELSDNDAISSTSANHYINVVISVVPLTSPGGIDDDCYDVVNSCYL